MPVLKPDETAVAAKVIDGEAIIMNLTNGAYYSMDGVGAVVWEHIAEGRSLDAIHDSIARRFDVEGARLRADLDRLVAELLAEGLIIATGNGASANHATSVAVRGTAGYQPPSLNKYTEMADLLALDPPMPALREVPDGSESDG
jgi:coenzyme PQQ synthesis protein D (PqqD)